MAEQCADVVVVDVKVKVLGEFAAGFRVVESETGEVGFGLTEWFGVSLERCLQTEFEALAFDENALSELISVNRCKIIFNYNFIQK